MKIAICVKQIPDPNAAQKLDGANRLARDGVEAVLDPGDEPAIEVGLRIAEQTEAEVILVSMGPERATDALRKGLSMGASRAILISDPVLAGSDAYATARVLAEVIAAESVDLVICGMESTDGYTGMVPPQLAELLGLPQLTFAKSYQLEGRHLVVQRQTEVGYQVVETDLPALMTVTAGIAEPRYATLKGIMAARNKEIRKVSLADLSVDAGDFGSSGAKEEVIAVAEAEQRQSGEVVDDPQVALDKVVMFLQQVKVI